MAKITLDLPVDERAALFKLAEQEERDPRAQALLIIRRELKKRGLLPANGLPMRGNAATPNTDALGVNDATQ